MDEKQLEIYRNNLLRMQEEILQNIIGETKDEENPFEIDGDLADRADAFNSVTISEGLSTTQKITIEQIRRALQRIKDGDYGKCVICGKEIEKDRLDAVPYADKCKEHMNSKNYE